MASKLDILSQVMLSLNSDQNGVMNNINSLLNNRDKEIDLIDKIKYELRQLSEIHADMQECNSFMMQLADAQFKKEAKAEEESEIGSEGETNEEGDSEK